jgi:ACR3 family arsenite efflux pump ArsB
MDERGDESMGKVIEKLSFFRKNLLWNIPLFMLLGLAFGYFFDATLLKSAVLPLTILMIYPMMVTLNIKSVFSKCNYKLEAVTQSINFILIPLVGFLIGQLFFSDSPLTAFGLLLIALLPTSGMTISWTGFARGNVSVAIKMTIIGLVLGTLATPIYARLLMGETIEVPLVKTFQQIGVAVFVPMVLGAITREILVKRYGAQRFKQEIKPAFPTISVLAVLGIIFVAMALKARSIVANPLIILNMLIPLILFYAINYTLASLLGRFLFPRADAIALVYGSVMRNLSVALAISVVAFGAQGLEIALIIAVAYVVQVQSAAWYVKLADKVFGAPESAVQLEGQQA